MVNISVQKRLLFHEAFVNNIYFFPISFRFGLNLLNERIAGNFETPNGWAHIAVNLKKDEHSTVSIEAYLNGVALDTEGGAGQPEFTAGDGRIVIGRFHSGLDGKYASAQVDQLLLYNNALTENEIGLLSQ